MPFLSAKKLKCSVKDRAAAIAVLKMMEGGKIEPYNFTGRQPTLGFNMATWCGEYHCGTVACIGGWMEKMMPDGKLDLMRDGGDQWDDLFLPKGYADRPGFYTVKRCARALRAKLTTGRASWR